MRKLVYNIAELLLSAVVYHIIAILFGAPFIQ